MSPASSVRWVLTRSAIAAAFTLSFVSGLVLPSSAQTDPELSAIQARLEAANRQTAQVIAALETLNGRIAEVSARAKAGEREAAEINSEIQASRDHAQDLDSRLAEARALQSRRAREIYKAGPARIIAALFEVRALPELSKLLTFFSSVIKQDRRVATELDGLLDQAHAERRTLSASSAAATEQAEELGRTKNALEADKARRAGSLKQLRQSILQAMAAEKALIAARAAEQAAREAAARKAAQAGQATPGASPSPRPCLPGKPVRDQRLAALLDWYAPANGPEPFMPPRLNSTDVVFTGVTSWYGPGFEGCATSSGATFRAAQMTAASLSLPLGTLLKVTAGGRAVVVAITDRGPYIAGRDLDLSRAAAQAIGVSGVTSVRMEVVVPKESAPPFP